MIRVEIEAVTDREFVEKWINTNFWGTPLYFRDALQRWPERHAAVISLLVLALAGFELEEIIADYELSVDSFRDELLAKENTSVQQAMRQTLARLEITPYLLAGGASPADLVAIRQWLVGTDCPAR